MLEDAKGSIAPLPQPVRAPNMQHRTSRRSRRPERGSSCLRFRPTKEAARNPGIHKKDADSTRERQDAKG